MTDLTEKFTGFENLVSADHTEIMEALNSILEALGAPPTSPTTTLLDVVTAIESQTSAQATQHTALMALLTDIFNNTDLIITNNSLNAQLLLNSQYSTFCECPTEAPLETLPLDVTPTSIVDEAKCRRIQFYLSVFGNWLNRVANYGASGAAITGGTLTSLLSLVAADAGIVATGAEVGAAAGIPGVVVGAAVGLITAVVYTFGGSVLIDYANQFNDPTLRDNMVQAMYAATNADEGYSAFKSTLLAGMDTIPAEVIYTLWWTAWSNDVYSGSPVVDDSAFDGTICGGPSIPEITECTNYVTSDYVVAGGTFQSIQIPPMSETYPWALAGDFYGFTVRIVAPNPGGGPGGVYSIYGGAEHLLFTIDLGQSPQTIGEHTTVLSIRTHTSEFQSAHWTVEICPPS